MVTIDERVEEFADFGDSAAWRTYLKVLLQDVARDQCHACADAVNGCKRGSLLPHGETLVRLSEVHQAVLKAEIK